MMGMGSFHLLLYFFPILPIQCSDANDINANIVSLWATETVEDEEERKKRYSEATELFVR